MTALHVMAFAELRTMTWGVSWRSDPAAPARLAVGREGASAVLEASLADNRLEGEGVALSFSDVSPLIQSRDAEGRLERRDRLCEVAGRVRIEGHEAEVQSLGWRSSAEAGTQLGRLDSFRFLAAWLDRQSGFSLTALRPHKARGHESDIVAAALIDDPPAPPVTGPRLSSTYTEAGFPARAGLELWFTEEDEDPDAGGTPQYPRRAAGEAAGPRFDWSQEQIEMHASLLRWHSHGHEGPGVYLLGQFP